jgi:hypothetical protein
MTAPPSRSDSEEMGLRREMVAELDWCVRWWINVDNDGDAEVMVEDLKEAGLITDGCKGGWTGGGLMVMVSPQRRRGIRGGDTLRGRRG